MNESWFLMTFLKTQGKKKKSFPVAVVVMREKRASSVVNKSLCHLNLLLISIKVVFCFLTKIHRGRHPIQWGYDETSGQAITSYRYLWESNGFEKGQEGDQRLRSHSFK